MRLDTRTLKVIYWLSAACVLLTLLGYVGNIAGLALGVSVQRREAFLVFGTVTLGHPMMDNSGAFHTWTPPVWLYSVQQPASAILSRQSPATDALSTRIPLWCLAIVPFAVGVPAFVTLRRRARAIKNGACPHCGYALVGIAPAAPCPECGRAKAAHG